MAQARSVHTSIPGRQVYLVLALDGKGGWSIHEVCYLGFEQCDFVAYQAGKLTLCPKACPKACRRLCMAQLDTLSMRSGTEFAQHLSK